MKIAFSTLGCPDFDWPDIYSMAKDLGFDGIEMRGLGDDTVRCERQALPRGSDRQDHRAPGADAFGPFPACPPAACSRIRRNWPATREEIRRLYPPGCPAGFQLYPPAGRPDNADREGEVDDEVVLAHLKEVLAPVPRKTGVTLLVETNGVYADTARLRDLLDAGGERQRGRPVGYAPPLPLCRGKPRSRPCRTWARISNIPTSRTPLWRMARSATASWARVTCPWTP